jgi:poly(hydroxyalkanoate) depolymerase family esterase
MQSMNRTMQEAMQWMRAGNLLSATEAIQRGLGTADKECGIPTPQGAPMPKGGTIDGEYSVIPHTALSTDTDLPADHPQERKCPEGEFVAGDFTCDAGTMRYKLFVPAGRERDALPLVVMLHGCTQSPDDFARGTRMNALAQTHGYAVLYPAQSQSNNPSKCWSWFRSEHQIRGHGEPAVIAGLTRHLVDSRGFDARRVYAAGMSAGGAMATVLAAAYPDVYAAIGVHSGLPPGRAHDLVSALAAMKGTGRAPDGAATATPVSSVPAIVFHGDRDTIVNPANGCAVIARCVATGSTGMQPDGTTVRAETEHGSIPGGRTYTRTIFTNSAGKVAAEQWVVHGGGHAWFGGDPSGSYTDVCGPDASDHMLRFFSGHARASIN